jgi:hypothetical protein
MLKVHQELALRRRPTRLEPVFENSLGKVLSRAQVYIYVVIPVYCIVYANHRLLYAIGRRGDVYCVRAQRAEKFFDN